MNIHPQRVLFVMLPGLLAALALLRQSGAAAEETIRIGWNGPLTGNCAITGVDSVNAVTMVFDEVNSQGGIHGRKLTLVAEDDGYDTKRAVTAYQKLTRIEHAPVIISPTWGGIFAVASQAEKDRVLMIDPLDCNDAIAALPDNTLCLATQSESIARGFAADLKRRGFQSVGLLIEQLDGWMELVGRETRTILEKDGITVLQEDSLPTTTDYKDALLRLKSRKVQAILLLGNDQMGLAPRQARDLGLEVAWYGVGSVMSAGFQSLAQGAAENIRVSSWLAERTPRFLDFLRRFQARYQRAPLLELATIPSYDAAEILVKCLQQTTPATGPVNTDDLRRCFLSTKNYDGLSGRITFDSDGAVRSIHEQLFRYAQGKLEPLAESTAASEAK